MEDHSSDSEKQSKELPVREIVAEWEGWFMCCEDSHFVALQRGRYVPGSLYLEVIYVTVVTVRTRVRSLGLLIVFLNLCK